MASNLLSTPKKSACDMVGVWEGCVVGATGWDDDLPEAGGSKGVAVEGVLEGGGEEMRG